MSLGSQKRDLIVRIDAETKSLEGGLQKSSAALRQMQGQLRKLDAAQAKQHKAMTQVGLAASVAGVAVAAGLGKAVSASMDFEESLSGCAPRRARTSRRWRRCASPRCRSARTPHSQRRTRRRVGDHGLFRGSRCGVAASAAPVSPCERTAAADIELSRPHRRLSTTAPRPGGSTAGAGRCCVRAEAASPAVSS